MAKTLRSRIAAVAVAALTMGVLSAVTAAPASATYTAPTLGTPTAVSLAAVDSTAYVAAPFTVGAMAINETFTISAKITTKPTGSSVGAYDLVAQSTWALGGSGTAALTGSRTSPTISAATRYNGYTFTAATAIAAADGFSDQIIFGFTPDKVGLYTIAVYTDGNGDSVAKTGDIKSGDTVKYYTLSVTAAPTTTVTLSKPVPGTYATYLASYRVDGAVLKVKLTDGTVASQLNGTQLVTVTIPSGVTLRKVNGSSLTSAVTDGTYNLAASDFDATGSAYLNVTGASAGTYGVTAQLAGSTTSSSVSLTYAAPSAQSTSAATYLSKTPQITGGTYYSDSVRYISSASTSTTFTIYADDDDAEDYLSVRLTDTDKKVFGSSSALVQDMVALTGDATTAGTSGYSAGKVTGTIAVPTALSMAPKGGMEYAYTIKNMTTYATATGTDTTVTAKKAVVDAWATKTPAATVRVVNGGSITLTAVCNNQFAAAYAGQAVTAQVTSGRNVQATATNLITDSAGKISFTVTDANPTSATLSDTVTFAGCGSTTFTINYVSAITVATLTMSPADTTLAAPSSSSVYTGSATASSASNRVTITATAKDADGVALAGVPVTLAIPTGVTLYSLDTLTAYTSSTGVATWRVYTTLAGTYHLTATGGGVTSDVYIKRTGGTARVVSVTTSAATAKAGESVVVTVKVADAYGNGVSGAAVEVIGSGAGYFQGISLSGSQTTDTNGEVKVAWISNAAGTATITAKITGDQSADGKDLIGTETAAAGFPAGVASATATVTYGAADTSALDTVKTQVAGLTTTITSIQTAISTLVASVTATLTSMSAQINKIMKKLKIK